MLSSTLPHTWWSKEAAKWVKVQNRIQESKKHKTITIWTCKPLDINQYPNSKWYNKAGKLTRAMIWATWVCTNNPINTPLGLKISPTPLQNHLQFLKPNCRELLLLLLHVLLVFLTKLHLIKYPTSSDPDPRLLNQIGEKSKWVQKYGSWSFPSSAVRPRNRI